MIVFSWLQRLSNVALGGYLREVSQLAMIVHICVHNRHLYMSLLRNHSYISRLLKHGMCLPIFILQKKAVRIITSSKLDSHCSPLFKSLGLIKFSDTALF